MHRGVVTGEQKIFFPSATRVFLGCFFLVLLVLLVLLAGHTPHWSGYAYVIISLVIGGGLSL